MKEKIHEKKKIIFTPKTKFMTPSLYYQCLLAGILGILFHMFVKKYPELRKRAIAANTHLSLKSFISDDWGSMVGSFVSVLITIIVVDELLHFKPDVINYVKGFFVLVGYTGSSILQAILGNTSKKLLDVIDKKTNIADAVTNDNISEPKND